MGLPLEFIVFSNIITDIHLFFFPLQIYLYFHVGKMKKGEKIRTIFTVLPQFSWDILLIIQKHKNTK